jgi:hypothetical protein
MGVGAAAVQAGISITDGKYNPAEGLATFAAGYAGAGQVFKGGEKLLNTYEEGRDEGDNAAIIEGAQKRWGEREDVMKYNKKYKPEERENILKIQKQLIAEGMTDFKEMDKCIKYMKESGVDLNAVANTPKGTINQDLRKARVVHDKSAEVRGYGINPFKQDDVQKYIATETKGLTGAALTRKTNQLNNQFDAIREYERANRAKQQKP